MNFDQIVIREFLKLNPGFTDTPDLIAQKRVGNFFTGAVNFPRTEEASITGGKVVKANVPDLANLFRNITPSIEIYKPTTNRDVAKVLFEKYGIIADINDITPTAISYDPLPLEVEIVAPTTSKTINGRVKVKLSQKVMDLTEIITTLDVDGVIDKYPTTTNYFVALKHYYGIDFTAYREELIKIPVDTDYYGSAYLSTFVKLLNLEMCNSPVTWNTGVYNEMEPYSLAKAKVFYNGPTSGHPLASNATSHVLEIDANCASSVSPKIILLHYDWRP